MTSQPLQTVLARRVTGTLWLAAWCGVLWAVAAPWRNLGGLESERLRWLEWWCLCAGLTLGFTMGRLARMRAPAGTGRSHAQALRIALYPPALVTVASLAALSVVDERGPIGVVATAFLAYWGGLDVAFGAVPLMEGRAYTLTRPADDENEDPEGVPRETWERF